MKTVIIPEQIIPPAYTVSFYESGEYSNYVTEDQPYDKRLSTSLVEWLDHFAPGWSAEFDCGDFGEGPAMVTVHFTSEDHAREFAKQFNKIVCPNSESMNHCPYLSASIIKARRGGKSECLYCGYKFTIFGEKQ